MKEVKAKDKNERPEKPKVKKKLHTELVCVQIEKPINKMQYRGPLVGEDIWSK